MSYYLSEKKPEKSGDYFIQLVTCPGPAPDTHEYTGERYEKSVAHYDKDTDIWEVLLDGEYKVEIKGDTFTSVVEGTAMGENLVITHWTDSSEAGTVEFPRLEMPFIAEDGNAFNNEELRDLYNEELLLNQSVSDSFDEAMGGYRVGGEEDFQRLCRWYNIALPYFNPDTQRFEYKEWVKFEYEGEGFYALVREKELVKVDGSERSRKDRSSMLSGLSEGFSEEGSEFLFGKILRGLGEGVFDGGLEEGKVN